MELVTEKIEIPMEHCVNIFGQCDKYVKKIERAFSVDIFNRDDHVAVRGSKKQAAIVKDILITLRTLSERGNTILEQDVDYAIAMGMEEQEDALLEIDKEVICHTVNGKPLKPKTMGQKEYVDAIHDNMIVFGMGPAGTGKTYLAMAMAITAFKNNEVERIILTRPAIEAGEKLGFLPGDLQSKVDPYLRPLWELKVL